MSRVFAAADLVAFAATRDLAASGRFYEHVLGLRLVESSAYANVYEVHGTQLRVTRVEEPVVAPYTVLGWRVSDIAATIDELAAAGVDFNRYAGMEQDERGVWTAPAGERVAWFRDPDGNTLSLQQPRTS